MACPFWEQGSLDWLGDIPDRSWGLGRSNCGKLHFFAITRHPWASSGRFPPSITSSRMPIRGKSSPRLFPLPGAHSGLLRSPLNSLPLCMHLFIANIFDLSNVPSKKMGIKIRKKYGWVAYINRYLSRWKRHNSWHNWPCNSHCTTNVTRGATDHATGICRWGQASRKLGLACPLFSFLNKLHYRHELDTHKPDFRRVRKPYLARLGPSGSFFAPASTGRISSA